MSEKVMIIAEAGVNHNGELQKALQLIDIAADAGADFVKFQTFSADKIVSQKAVMAEYQKTNLSKEDTQWNMLKKLEIPQDWYPILKAHCAHRGIQFLSTGFDEEAIDFLLKWDIPLIKIPSGEITNLPLLRHIAKKKLPVVMSTGMADIQEVGWALEVLMKEGLKKDDITILHCNTDYPTKMADVNLLAMQHILQELGVKVGYSDHTLGIEVAIAAVALNAKIIEKHFTIDRTLEGPDHAASLEPLELSQMISSIRNIEMAMAGNGLKSPSESEVKNLSVARKSIHARHNIPMGSIIQEKDLIALRPGDGLSCTRWDDVVGATAVQSIQQGEKITWECLLQKK
jgi:N-acetylneuraminate synthase/N,N'-diacetyllegionaminate synthase